MEKIALSKNLAQTKKRLKIVIFGLLGRGGNLYYTACLANACAKKHETFCVIPTYSDANLFSKKVKLLKINAPPNITGTLKSIMERQQHRDLVKKIRQINPDVLHFKDNHIFYLYYIKKLNNYKIYWTCHDPEFHSGEKFKLTTYGDSMVHKALEKRADKIIVHGNIWKDYLVKEHKLSDKKIIVIKHGAFSFLTKYGSSEVQTEKNNLLFFGRIVEYKGIDTLLNAFKLVVKQKKNCVLTIAGQGDFKPYSKLITPEIEKNVKVLNRFINDDELADLFRKSEFVVLPYNDATQSGVIPVAYAFRKPIIITNSGALPEMVIDGQTGILIEPKNEQQLSEAILTMLEKPEKTKQMGEEGYDWMKKELDWDIIVEKSYKDL